MLNFLWRACNEYFPTRVTLFSKYVPISQLCPLYNRFLETTLHYLVTCSFSQVCLQSSGIINATHASATYSSFAEWLASVMCQHANLTLSKVAMILWSIWKARNLVVWHDTYPHVDEVVRTAQFTLDQWIEAQLKNFIPSITSLNPMDGKELWTKPNEHTIKINVDAALFNTANKYGYAMIARDHSGRLLSAKTECCMGKVAADLAEAIAFKEALSWIKSEGWRNVVIETDCYKVVQSLRNSETFTSPFGLVISDCKQLMIDFDNAVFYFVKRSANRVAHCLARQSISLPDCIFSETNAPSEVLDLCVAESMNE